MKRGPWSFRNPVDVRFGAVFPGEIVEALTPHKTLLLAGSGARARGWVEPFQKLAEMRGIELHVSQLRGENPTLLELEALLASHKGEEFEQIVALGGGSVLDMGKALAYGLQKDAADPRELLAWIRAGQALPDLRPLPLHAVPTTSGTGSEVTPFATIWDSEAKKKLSLTSGQLYPLFAWIDPTLTLTLPWAQTLSTALDAFCQALEGYCNKRCTPLTDALALRAIPLIFHGLPGLKEDPSALSWRTDLAEASLLAGLVISQTRTGLSHSISYPLTAHLNLAHGLACTFSLCDVWEHNLRVDEERMGRLAAAIGLRADEFSAAIDRWLRALGYADELAVLGLEGRQILSLAGEMITKGRADNNPAPVDHQDLERIVASALQRWGMGAC